MGKELGRFLWFGMRWDVGRSVEWVTECNGGVDEDVAWGVEGLGLDVILFKFKGRRFVRGVYRQRTKAG